MENRHRNKLQKKFKQFINNKKIVVLHIPDEYDFMDEKLIKILQNRVPRFIQI